jgi:hypothetical protein
MMLNKAQGASSAAFGSDAVVKALFKSGMLEASDAAEALLTLMRWRYRFVYPFAAVLNIYAAQYRNNPPGLPLREIAEYIHDCMRDSGLFGGPENTELNESMAMRLYMLWLNLLAEWLMVLWGAGNFSDDTATRLTDWCVQECLPLQPSVVHGSIKARMGSLTGRILISHMLLNSHLVTKYERASAALMAVKSALKLSDEEYLQIITEILNDTRRTELKS